ncbi:MAG: HSP90 family protein [Acidobacteriota bacterium]|nr:HSP90 family protein [Acidobacteriota bacterium]
MSYKFQIDLSGIIELLSKHLYSSPQVYLRELLQNSVDAIQARRSLESNHPGEIRVRRFRDEKGVPCLLFEDNGSGLTEDEIHRFLATIGKSSKRGIDRIYDADFVGQFGIGLLSCFVVSDTILVKTRSIRENSPTIEWRGVDDGSYSISAPSEQIECGTQVLLKCKPGFETYFEDEFVKTILKNFGGLLPFPIIFNDSAQINDEPPPWKERFFNAAEEREAFIEYGRSVFKIDFIDFIKLGSPDGAVEGVAFVLPFSPSLASKKTHRVYLKNMLLSENAEGLMPEWAFFVKSIVNVNRLRPTASREAFYEDEDLIATRAALGSKLRSYLLELAENDPAKLRRLISIHYLSIKALAVEDDDFYRMFIDWLPFETTTGYLSLGEYKKRNERILFIQNHDQFRQISQVALAQGLSVINASYVYDADLLVRHQRMFLDIPVEEVTPARFTQTFSYLTLDEQEETADFLRAADEALKPFRCQTDMRRFSPSELPAIYLVDEQANFRRSVEQTKQVVDDLWSSVLDNIDLPSAQDEYSQLCFNYSNPLIAKISRGKNENLQKLAVKILYAQALLLSHRPLDSGEMKMLNESLLELLEHSADFDVEGEWIQ